MRKKFDFTMFGSRYPVTVKVNSYLNNGNLYVGLNSDDGDGYDEPFSDITANTDLKLPPFTAAIKNYSENEGTVDFP